ncbi:hypothetical protein PoB_001276900 [Plakobranchus ocellatus]|uniref:Uncharacterized protein n=1 Tax=Plakobranchus ocellatus TaxID=259542 RepID=A0AAV3YT62_9GAST|nr:hypothetical protein PoB_001276900 [Plakobranchus ocellatus]
MFESQSGPSQIFIAPLYPPSTKWVAGSKVKAARKPMANYHIMPYAKNNQDPNPGSPMLGLSVEPTLLFTNKHLSVSMWRFRQTFASHEKFNSVRVT